MPKSAKASRKTKTKADPKYPKRPPNSYSLFQKDFFAGETEGTFADKVRAARSERQSGNTTIMIEIQLRYKIKCQHRRPYRRYVILTR